MVTIPFIAAALLGAAQATAPQTTAPSTTPAMPSSTAPQTTPGAGAATTNPTPPVGTAIVDQAGNPLGTVAQISGSVAVIDTGTIKAGVPLTAIGKGANGGFFTTATKAQLDAAATQGAAQLKSMLVAGTSVHGVNGQEVVGTIKEADEQFVTLTTPKGDVRFPVNAFAVRNDVLVVSMTPAQFDAAVTQSLGAAAK